MYSVLWQPLCIQNIPFIWWTTARQVINMVSAGFEPAIFKLLGQYTDH